MSVWYSPSLFLWIDNTSLGGGGRECNFCDGFENNVNIIRDFMSAKIWIDSGELPTSKFASRIDMRTADF